MPTPPDASNPAASASASHDAPGKSAGTASSNETATAPATPAEIEADARNASSFAFQLFTRAKKPAENLLVSGTSVRLALGTLFVGARGTTASELGKALAVADDSKKAASLARAELAGWQTAKGGAELAVASRLWIDRRLPVSDDFTKIAEGAFGAGPAAIDYEKPEDARKTINGWVSEKTNAKIADLLPPGSVDPQTRLVVTNAIWFKGSWQFPFPKGATKKEPFKVDGKKVADADTMHLSDSFRLAKIPGLSVLELRYAESELAMWIALPDDPGSKALAKLEASLGPDTLGGWKAALKNARVNVALPRFTFRSGGAMNAPLQELGMKLAFTEKADFGGITGRAASPPLFVGQVFHRTWIAVDELGSEAAAATGATMRTTSLDTSPIVDFKADHPFLFVIADTKTARALFVGRVARPSSP